MFKKRLPGRPFLSSGGTIGSGPTSNACSVQRRYADADQDDDSSEELQYTATATSRKQPPPVAYPSRFQSSLDQRARIAACGLTVSEHDDEKGDKGFMFVPGKKKKAITRKTATVETTGEALTGSSRSIEFQSAGRIVNTQETIQENGGSFELNATSVLEETYGGFSLSMSSDSLPGLAREIQCMEENFLSTEKHPSPDVEASTSEPRKNIIVDVPTEYRHVKQLVFKKKIITTPPDVKKPPDGLREETVSDNNDSFSVHSEEDHWEMEQLSRVTRPILKTKTSEGPGGVSLEISGSQNWFKEFDIQLGALKQELSNLQEKSAQEERLLQDATEEENHAVAVLNEMKNNDYHLSSSLTDSNTRLEEYLATVISHLEDMGEFMAEKQDAVNLAAQTLYQLEKDFGQQRQRNRRQHFLDDLDIAFGFTTDQGRCDNGMGKLSSLSTVVESGSNVEQGDERSRAYYLNKTRNQRLKRRRRYIQYANAAKKDQHLVYQQRFSKYHWIGDNIDGWDTESSACDTSSSDSDTSADHSLATTQAACTSDTAKEKKLDQFKKTREEFSRGVMEIFADVHQDFYTIDSVLQTMNEFLQQHPIVFCETAWNIGIREFIAFLVKWETLFWDPFFTAKLWKPHQAARDSNAIIDIEELSWYNPVLDFVQAVERITQNPLQPPKNEGASELSVVPDTETSHHSSVATEENMMSYLMYEVIQPRILHYVRYCWDPLSYKQTMRLRHFISRLIDYRETPYLEALQTVLRSIVTRFEEAASDLLTVPNRTSVTSEISSNCETSNDTPIESTSRSWLLKRILWRGAKLAQMVAHFEGILHHSMLQRLIWNVIATASLNSIRSLLKIEDNRTPPSQSVCDQASQDNWIGALSPTLFMYLSPRSVLEPYVIMLTAVPASEAPADHECKAAKPLSAFLLHLHKQAGIHDHHFTFSPSPINEVLLDALQRFSVFFPRLVSNSTVLDA